MAGCKRCALKGGGEGKGKKEEKRKGKRRKNGDQNRFFFLVFFYVCAHVFSYAQWSFFKYIWKTVSRVSRVSRSYPLLFAIKNFMVSQFGDL